MTKKVMTTTNGEEMTVNIDQIVFSKKHGDIYCCRLSTGDNISFTTDPLA